jgi:hypothetical protein
VCLADAVTSRGMVGIGVLDDGALINPIVFNIPDHPLYLLVLNTFESYVMFQII